MRYTVLATDYDGTLAKDGVVDRPTIDALNRWQQSGRSLVLITGRQLTDVLRLCPCLDSFAWVVAENGALLYEPATQTEILLTEPPPPELAQRLRDRIAASDATLDPESEFGKLVQTEQIGAVREGRVVVATWLPHLTAVEESLDELGLDSGILLNKEAVMILPKGVDKASGLKAALNQMGVLPEQAVGVGDAENDLPFLLLCGFSAAVANALPEVKQQVQWVATQSRGAGVVELIDTVLGENA